MVVQEIYEIHHHQESNILVMYRSLNPNGHIDLFRYDLNDCSLSKILFGPFDKKRRQIISTNLMTVIFSEKARDFWYDSYNENISVEESKGPAHVSISGKYVFIIFEDVLKIYEFTEDKMVEIKSINHSIKDVQTRYVTRIFSLPIQATKRGERIILRNSTEIQIFSFLKGEITLESTLKHDNTQPLLSPDGNTIIFHNREKWDNVKKCPERWLYSYDIEKKSMKKIKNIRRFPGYFFHGFYPWFLFYKYSKKSSNYFAYIYTNSGFFIKKLKFLKKPLCFKGLSDKLVFRENYDLKFVNIFKKEKDLIVALSLFRRMGNNFFGYLPKDLFFLILRFCRLTFFLRESFIINSP